MRHDFKDIKIKVLKDEYTITQSDRDEIFGEIGVFNISINNVSFNYFGLMTYSGIRIYEGIVKVGLKKVITMRGTSIEQILQDIINYIETCKA